MKKPARGTSRAGSQNFQMSGNKKPTKIHGGLKAHLGRLGKEPKPWRS
jgi:hypothetical protein